MMRSGCRKTGRGFTRANIRQGVPSEPKLSELSILVNEKDVCKGTPTDHCCCKLKSTVHLQLYASIIVCVAAPSVAGSHMLYFRDRSRNGTFFFGVNLPHAWTLGI